MLTISPERMVVSYTRKRKIMEEKDDIETDFIEDIQKFTQEITILEDKTNKKRTKIIRHSRKEEIILEHHINNYVGNSTTFLIEDMSEEETIIADVDDAFEAFLSE